MALAGRTFGYGFGRFIVWRLRVETGSLRLLTVAPMSICGPLRTCEILGLGEERVGNECLARRVDASLKHSGGLPRQLDANLPKLVSLAPHGH